MALTAVALSGVVLIIPHLFENRMKKTTLALKEANNYFLEKLNDLIGGRKVLVFYQAEYLFFEKIFLISDQIGKENVNYKKETGIIQSMVSLLNISSQLIMFAMTAIFVYFNQITIGIITTSGNLAGLIFSNIAQISGNLTLIKGTGTLLPCNIIEPSLTMSKVSNSLDFKKLSIKNLSYGYNGKSIFKDANFEINKGDKFALIGSSGVGKSTLLNIITQQITPDKGDVVLVGAKNQSEVWKYIAYVDQEPYLFNLTIRENIVLNNSFCEHKLKGIMHQLEIDSFANSEEMIQENGNNFSGGQKKKIALARALYAQKPILLLDETTSSLDKKNALKIEKYLLGQPDLTVLMVTHHLNDKIRGLLTGILEVEHL